MLDLISATFSIHQQTSSKDNPKDPSKDFLLWFGRGTPHLDTLIVRVTATLCLDWWLRLYFSGAMLRISRISGEELTIALEEDLVPDVRALKQHLHRQQDLPPRFRQRLLLDGQCLEDTAALQPTMELELVVLSFIRDASPDELQQLTAAAVAGHSDKVCALTHNTLPHTTQ